MGADLRDVGKAKGFLIWTASAGTKALPPRARPCSDAGHAREGADLCVAEFTGLLLCSGRTESLSIGTCEQFQADP